MKNTSKVIIIWLIFSMWLSIGCRPESNEQPTTTPEATITKERNLTELPTPKTTPTQMLTPSPQPLRNYPDFKETSFTPDFLFDGQSSTCKLPCWHGLVIGRSGREEISDTFSALLNLDVDPQLFSTDAPVIADSPSETVVEGAVWYFDTLERFWFDVFYDRQTYILRGLELFSSYSSHSLHLSPQRIIREMGEPSAFLMSWYGIGMGYGYYDLASLRLRMVYNQGMVFTIEKNNPIYLILEEDLYSGSIEICLGGDAWQESGPSSWRIDLVEPMPEGLENLTPVQAYIITFFDSVEWQTEMYPVSEFFGLSLEDITQLALEDQDACLYTELSYDTPWPTPAP